MPQHENLRLLYFDLPVRMTAIIATVGDSTNIRSRIRSRNSINNMAGGIITSSITNSGIRIKLRDIMAYPKLNTIEIISHYRFCESA